MKNLIRIILLTFCVTCTFNTMLHAKRHITPIYVHDAQSLAFWLRGNFIYQEDITRDDSWKPVYKTIEDFGGDCEDFAILTSTVLSELYIPNNIVVVKFKNKNIGHAITVFKELDGNYSYMDNRFYVASKRKSLLLLIAKRYPNWEYYYIANKKGEHIKTFYSKN